MFDLFLIKETLTYGYLINILDIFTLGAILSSIWVILSKNPVVSILFLIGLFALISSYLIILGLSFIGLSYLIVYIGAVSILFLFILMLINIRISELQSNTSNSILLVIILGIFIFFICLLDDNLAILNNYLISLKHSYFKVLDAYNHDTLFFVTSKIWDANFAESNHITSIGNIMYSNYNMWLIIASFILLLSMTGAIVITIKQKPKNVL